MASVSTFDMIVLAAATLLVAVLAGVVMVVRRISRRRRRRRSSHSYAKTYFNESLTREQIAAAAREQREAVKARLAAAAEAQEPVPAPHTNVPPQDSTAQTSAELRNAEYHSGDPSARSST